MAEIEHHRAKGPGVGGYVHDQTLVGPAGQKGHQNQVSRRADRQELSETLNQAQNNSLKGTHGALHANLNLARSRAKSTVLC